MTAGCLQSGSTEEFVQKLKEASYMLSGEVRVIPATIWIPALPMDALD
ncbi:hypothetical protein [Endozoicomonas elysicola]|nr:hypothetical protein [Endozoicomonas elysicola]